MAREPGWRADLSSGIDLLHEITSGMKYCVVLRFEWTCYPRWITLTIPEVRGRSRQAAVGKAIVMAEASVSMGWDRITIESAHLVYQ
jgi:hypothetical protein